MAIDRRTVLAFLAGVGTDMIGHAAYDGLVHLNSSIWELLQKFSSSPPDTLPPPTFSERFSEEATAVKSLLTDRGKILKIVGGRAHFRYPGSMHPDDRAACDTVMQYAEHLSQKHEFDPIALEVDPTGSFICAGNPVSNAWSRTFLEYAFVDARRPELGLTRLPQPRLKLAFELELHKGEISRQAKQANHKSTKSGQTVANWSIKTKMGFLSPDTQREGSDYLLISRIPNWIEIRQSPRADFQSVVTIFGGTHGVGTAAIKCVLEDSPLLKNILLSTSRYEFWQVLLKINSMGYGNHPYSNEQRLIPYKIAPDFGVEPIQVLRV